MNVSNLRIPTRLFAAVLVGAALLPLAATPAAARERHTTVTGANGKSATRSVERAKGDVSSSTTGPNGKSSSRVVDRSAGATSATLTGPNGKTATRETTRTDSGSTTTMTGANGKTAAVTVDRQP